jgi:hypothetical protein
VVQRRGGVQLAVATTKYGLAKAWRKKLARRDKVVSDRSGTTTRSASAASPVHTRSWRCHRMIDANRDFLDGLRIKVTGAPLKLIGDPVRLTVEPAPAPIAASAWQHPF